MPGLVRLVPKAASHLLEQAQRHSTAKPQQGETIIIYCDSEIDRMGLLPVSSGGSRRSAADSNFQRAGDARVVLPSLLTARPNLPRPSMDQNMPVWIMI